MRGWFLYMHNGSSPQLVPKAHASFSYSHCVTGWETSPMETHSVRSRCHVTKPLPPPPAHSDSEVGLDMSTEPELRSAGC